MTNLLKQRGKILWFFLCFIISNASAENEKRVYFCDKLTKEPLEFVHIRGYVYYDGSWGRFSTFSDSTGVVLLDVALDAPVGKIAISRVGYSPIDIQESTIGELPDTIFFSQNTRLDAVTAVYKRENGKIIYNVEADSSVKNSDRAFETILRTPTLYNRGWDILSENSPKIRFRLNGASDYTLGRYPGEFLGTMLTKNLKRIEVDESNIDKDGSVEVNIVMKRRLLGFKAMIFTDIEDNGISNTLKMEARVARFTLNTNIGYIIKNNRGQTSVSERSPEATSDITRYERKVETSRDWYNGLRSETILTYNINGSSDLWAFYRHFCFTKLHPLENVISGTIYNQSFGSPFDYTAFSITRKKDYENELYLSYRNRLGPEESDGNVKVSYGFYDSPNNNSYDLTYGNPSSEHIPDMLFDYAGRIRSYYRRHILEAEFSRNFGSRHYLSASATYESTYQLSRQQFVDSFISDAAPVYVVPDDYSFPYTAGYFNAYACYQYNASIFRTTLGGSFTHNSYKADYSSTDYSARLRSRFNNVSPYAKLYLPIDGYGSVSLSYNSLLYTPPAFAMHPYVNRWVPGQITYGNWNCAPQHTHSVSLETSSYRKGWSTGASLTATFTNDLLATHRFMHDDLLHITYGNIARERTLRFGARVSKSFGRNLYASVNGAVSHIDLRSGVMSQHNSGFYSSIRSNVSYNFNDIVHLSLEGSCSTSSPILHGKKNGRHSYGVDLSRSFGNFSISLYANNFLTPYRTIETRRQFDGYKLINSTRLYQANFGISLSFNIRFYRTLQEGAPSLRYNPVKSNLDV